MAPIVHWAMIPAQTANRRAFCNLTSSVKSSGCVLSFLMMAAQHDITTFCKLHNNSVCYIFTSKSCHKVKVHVH
ncbi:hypothetical protein Mapa_008997 [Marchantia paleacea]|nr:hypothetical protein Mapa_008997 [Marchantia paleacea]